MRPGVLVGSAHLFGAHCVFLRGCVVSAGFRSGAVADRFAWFWSVERAQFDLDSSLWFVSVVVR